MHSRTSWQTRRLAPLGLLISALWAVFPWQAEARELTAIQTTVESRGVVFEFWIEGDASGLRHERITDPERLVIDLPGARSGLSSDRIVVGTPSVSRLRIGQHQDKLRIVVDATEADGDALAGARLVETERGVALLVGNVAVAGAPRATGAIGPTATRGTGEETLELAAELRRTSEELREAARELRASGLDTGSAGPTAKHIAPAPETLPAPLPVEPPEAPPATEPRTEMAAIAPTPSPPVKRSAPLRDGEVVPVSEITYQTVLDWIETHRDTDPSFRPGDVIRLGDIQKLRPFLPPGYYNQFLFDGVEVEIQPTGDLRPHASYEGATLQYSGQTSIAEDGSIQNYVAGRPFTADRMRQSDPRDAGYMAAWNYIYRWGASGWKSMDIPFIYLVPGDGSTHPPEFQEILLGGGHVERSIGMSYHRVYLSHLAHYAEQDHTMRVADADEQHFKDWIQFQEPFEMRGMAFVFERFRDPREPDQVNSYLPTERRVRRLSAKERADSFVGSEMTMDDFEGFSGRVLDYEWKYIGEKRVMHVLDSKWDFSRYQGPQSHIPVDGWQLRPCHVIESRPVYPEHPYGRKLTFFDSQTFNIASVVIFDHDDRLLKVVYTMYNWPGGSPDGDPEATVTEWRTSGIINVQSQRSLVTWGHDVEVPVMTPSKVRRLFSVSNLTGGR